MTGRGCPPWCESQHHEKYEHNVHTAHRWITSRRGTRRGVPVSLLRVADERAYLAIDGVTIQLDQAPQFADVLTRLGHGNVARAVRELALAATGDAS